PSSVCSTGAAPHPLSFPTRRSSDLHHSLYPVLNRQTNPRMTPFTYFERVGAHLALWGNHYAIIERRHGDVVALWPVHPRYVEPYLDAAGQLQIGRAHV